MTPIYGCGVHMNTNQLVKIVWRDVNTSPSRPPLGARANATDTYGCRIGGPASFRIGDAPKAAKKGGGAAGTGAAAAAGDIQGTGQRQLFMQFTCNRCEGVSQYMVNKNAYDDGIVICTCQSCGVRHLIADNLKKVRCLCRTRHTRALFLLRA